MEIRPRTKRRLLILAAIIGVVVVLFLAVYAASEHRNAVALRALRDDGMKAYQSGDFGKSTELLEEYLGRTNNADPEALFAFGKSRSNVPLPGNRHLTEAIRIFRQYLDTVKPGDGGAQHELLKLYVQAGFNAEAITLSDDLLAKNPRDTQVLWAEVEAYNNQGRRELALETCKKLNAVEPLNVNAQAQTLALMSEINIPADQVIAIAYAESMRKTHDQDPRFEILLADAYLLAKQEDQARQWLVSAAAGRTPPDAAFVQATALALDNAGLFAESAAMLVRASDTLTDPIVQRLLAQRLWQHHKISDLLLRLKSQDAASPASDGTLLGYRALALDADGKIADARAMVKAMSHRNDSASAAWAIALRVKFARRQSVPPTPSTHSPRLSRAIRKTRCFI